MSEGVFDPAYFDPEFFAAAVSPREFRFDPRAIPPSIMDARSRAFGEVIRRAISEPNFGQLLFEWLDQVDTRMFPFLIREFGLQRFVEPGMSEEVIRRLLKGSYQLHARMGFIDGVRTGLGMLGIGVTRWQQWFQAQPPAAPGTHVATLSVASEVFVSEGRAITARLQRAIGNMVAQMQRKSQFVALRLSTAGDTESQVPVRVGMAVVSRLRVSPSVEPITTLIAVPAVFVGAVISSRIRISPRIAA